MKLSTTKISLLLFSLPLLFGCKPKKAQTNSHDNAKAMDKASNICLDEKEIAKSKVDPNIIPPPENMKSKVITFPESKYSYIELNFSIAKANEHCHSIKYQAFSDGTLLKEAITSFEDAQLIGLPAGSKVEIDSRCCIEAQFTDPAKISASTNSYQDKNTIYYCGASHSKMHKKKTSTSLSALSKKESSSSDYLACQLYKEQEDQNRNKVKEIAFNLCESFKNQPQLLNTSDAMAAYFKQGGCLNYAELVYTEFDTNTIGITPNSNPAHLGLTSNDQCFNIDALIQQGQKTAESLGLTHTTITQGSGLQLNSSAPSDQKASAPNETIKTTAPEVCRAGILNTNNEDSVFCNETYSSMSHLASLKWSSLQESVLSWALAATFLGMVVTAVALTSKFIKGAAKLSAFGVREVKKAWPKKAGSAEIESQKSKTESKYGSVYPEKIEIETDPDKVHKKVMARLAGKPEPIDDIEIKPQSNNSPKKTGLAVDTKLLIGGGLLTAVGATVFFSVGSQLAENTGERPKDTWSKTKSKFIKLQRQFLAYIDQRDILTQQAQVCY